MTNTLQNPAPAATSFAPTRVIVVDDHPVYRHGLCEMLSAEEGITVCGQAGTATEALELVRCEKPDLTIVDISMPETNGIELLRQIKAELPDMPVVVLSMHDGSQYALGALRAGATAYVIKYEPFSQVVAAIQAACKGECYLSPRFRDQLAFKVIANPGRKGSPIDKLSERELEVLRMIGTGLSTRDVAQTLGLSTKTVETHRAHIKDKLRFRDSSDMVRFAVDWVGQQQPWSTES